MIEDRQLSEWHDFEAVTARLRAEQAEITFAPSQADLREISQAADEDALLLALLEVESKLEEDLTRKPKHQKPALQAQWREEIAMLKAQLGL